MESLLDTLEEVDSVLAVFVANTKGQVLLFRTHHIYDRDVLGHVAGHLATIIESLQLQSKDWETLVASFGEGKLVVRNLGPAVLALIAEPRLVMSFATVALRISTAKLKEAIKRGELDVNLTRPPPPVPSLIKLAGLDSSQITVTSSSPSTGMVWASSLAKGAEAYVPVEDESCSAFLEACAKALSRSVGPLSRIFVRDAVRKVCGMAPFATKHAPKLMAELETRILDRNDRVTFRREVVG